MNEAFSELSHILQEASMGSLMQVGLGPHSCNCLSVCTRHLNLTSNKVASGTMAMESELPPNVTHIRCITTSRCTQYNAYVTCKSEILLKSCDGIPQCPNQQHFEWLNIPHSLELHQICKFLMHIDHTHWHAGERPSITDLFIPANVHSQWPSSLQVSSLQVQKSACLKSLANTSWPPTNAHLRETQHRHMICADLPALANFECYIYINIHIHAASRVGLGTHATQLPMCTCSSDIGVYVIEAFYRLLWQSTCA